MAMVEGLKVVRYSAACKDVWDAFVAASRNGTFLLRRDYMDYHSERFSDHSLMFFRADELVAVMPAHIAGRSFCSHNGLTYGGLVLSPSASAAMVVDIFNLLCTYLRDNTEAETVVYRPIPHIYHRYPCEEDLYALFRAGAVLKERKISSVVWQEGALPFSTLRKRKVKAAHKAGFSVVADSNFAPFWAVLQENLQKVHAAAPVHSLAEVELLASRFPHNIKLYKVVDEGGETVAGTLLYITERVVRVQYIGSIEKGREKGALDFLFDYLVHKEYARWEFFDFGTSVEAGGRVLNKGLVFQKEGFGGRGVVYDTYEFDIKNIPND